MHVTKELKDERLVGLAGRFNVAQFVSFSPGAEPEVRHSRIHGHAPDEKFADLQSAVQALMEAADGSVNVRSFLMGRDKGNPFKYGLTAGQAVSLVRSLAADGYFTIVNETVDKADGGVSGVAQGGILEFVPLDIPRGVERPGAVSVPNKLGFDLITTVYGFHPDIPAAEDMRVEFSVHPKRVGYGREHTLLWEIGYDRRLELEAALFWPNRFSKFIGDKAFGLLIAHHLGLPVPTTTVIPRAIAPFQFGRPTGTVETWMRTCPAVPRPGHFTTTFGWTDPYALMSREDPGGSAIASILAQENVDPVYSGASLPGAEGEADFVEGVAGAGDEFMIGRRSPDPLPPYVVDDVRALSARARQALGPVRMEYVHDGRQAWVVQLHLSADKYRSSIIVPGTPRRGWLEFDPEDRPDPLNALNDVIARARDQSKGIQVIAPVGLTSHIGDSLRKAGIPAKLHPRDLTR